MKNIYLLLISLCLTMNVVSQVHHNIQDNATYSVERIAKFSVSDASRDVLEIVNGTQYSNRFLPNIWAHRESDNRVAFNIFSSIKSTVDNGTSPIFTFRAELRNSIYDSYPYPWGSSVSQVQNRPLFSWSNYNSTKMLMKANGNLGLGTTNPSAQFHSTGTLRFQNLPNATTPTYLLGTDASGNVKEYPASSSGGGSDKDWEKTGGGTPTSIYHNIYTHGKVGISTSSPTAELHTRGTVRFENLPTGSGNPSYLLGIDNFGNVKKYQQLIIFLKKMKESLQKQENQIALLQNQIANLKKDAPLDVHNKSISFSTNYPNPFSLSTTINYSILRKVTNAKIIIYNSNGSTIKTYNLNERKNKGKLIIQKEGMIAGVYFYTMIADGIVVGTKKMIVK